MKTNIIHLKDEEDFPLNLSNKAVEAFKEAILEEGLEQETGIRVAINGGGCAGLQYSLDFDTEKEYDIVFKVKDLKIMIDCIASMHLEGIKIDFQMGISGAGFKFNNPYAKTTCGCGSSFS